jgi:hypothetical protein
MSRQALRDGSEPSFEDLRLAHRTAEYLAIGLEWLLEVALGPAKVRHPYRAAGIETEPRLEIAIATCTAGPQTVDQGLALPTADGP